MSITDTAQAFFEACESGKGWEKCKKYCKAGATFSSQAEPVSDLTTLEQYTDWMKGLMTILTDGTYKLKSFATDSERQNVAAYAIFSGTHLAGGPIPPTGKRTNTDYVYVMQFADNEISHMTKIWNATATLKELGWA